MSKSGIDAEVNNQIFRKDFSAIIAKRRDLASIGPVRLYDDSNDYLAGEVLARITSTGVFKRWSAASGASYDSVCVLFENVLAYEFDATVTGGALARAIMGGYVYKDKLVDYDSGAKSAMAAVEQTDASGVTVVKF